MIAWQGMERIGLQRIWWYRLVVGGLVGFLLSLIWGVFPYVLMGDPSHCSHLEAFLITIRYRVERLIAGAPFLADESRIVIVDLDKQSTKTLGVSVETMEKFQHTLAEKIRIIESAKPQLIALDLDFESGKPTDALLDKTLRDYNNIVLAYRAAPDINTSELYRKVPTGYAEMPCATTNLVFRLPVNFRKMEGLTADAIPPFACLIVDQLKEGDRWRLRTAKFIPGASWCLSDFRKFPTIPLAKVLDTANPDLFKGKIVLVGGAPTQSLDPNFQTPLGQTVSGIDVQANAVSTLLNASMYADYNALAAEGWILVFGTLAGSALSMLKLSMRLKITIAACVAIVMLAQLGFHFGEVILPCGSPVLILLSCYITSTVLFLETEEAERSRKFALAMQMRAEDERKRIAKDLHDETLPNLARVTRLADTMQSRLPDDDAPREMRERIESAIVEMRRIINDLHPVTLDNLGLAPALEDLLLKSVQHTALEARFSNETGTDNFELEQFVELSVYRIVQEAVNNVEKHAQASKIVVSLSADERHLFVKIADNGKGLGADGREDSRGLLNIRQRTELVGGTVTWHKPSAFDTGTELVLRIPKQRVMS